MKVWVKDWALDMAAGERVEGSLEGARVCFTGKLAAMTREDATALVRRRGGVVASFPGGDTDYLVIGGDGWPLRADGRLTRKLERARALQDAGRRIEILPEERFLEILGVEEPRGTVQSTFTISQLGRILGVSRGAILRWMRAGLVRPVRTVHRLAWFDFREVASARALCALVAAGVPLSRIRRSLELLGRWLPGAGGSLPRLPLIEREGRLLVRLENGGLAEPSGQLVFDFMEREAPQGAAVVDRPPQTVDEWFERAVDREDAGDIEGAIEAYRHALRGGARPEVCFNLANALYALGRRERAVERFRQAVELDPEYVEAWNNLGNVLAELGEREEALASFERALDVEPAYADAHYNLAEVLAASGRVGEAREHWRAYLRHDPASSWAEHVRERLGAAEGD